MDNEFAVVITTCANDEDARIIIDSLLVKKLVACIQVFHVNSFYSWKGSVANDSESILLIKCRNSKYDEIEKDILINHKYETPEIIQLPITTGFSGYLQWMDEVSR